MALVPHATPSHVAHPPDPDALFIAEIGFAVVALPVLLGLFALARSLRRHIFGVWTTGVVVDHKRRSKSMTVVVHFVVDGTTYVAESFSEPFFPKRIGAEWELRYLPSDPTQNALRGQNYGPPIACFFFAAGLAAIPGFFLWLAYRYV
jgi:hypothetical protein